MIATAEKIVALLESLSPADLQSLPDAARRRLAERCRYAAEMAEPKPTPKAGVLAALRDGGRYE